MFIEHLDSDSVRRAEQAMQDEAEALSVAGPVQSQGRRSYAEWVDYYRHERGLEAGAAAQQAAQAVRMDRWPG